MPNMNLVRTLSDNFFSITNYLKNPRLRKDLKVLKISQRGYTYHGWKICKKIRIVKCLEKPMSIDEIIRMKKIKNKEMLEALLDFLVGQGILNFTNNKYVLAGKEPKYSEEDEIFIKTNCPGSWEWSHFLYKHAEEVLVGGHPHFKTGFTDTKVLSLWSAVFEESLHSIRQIAIEKVTSNLKKDAKIADLGCGSGISLIEILANVNNEINLVGFDNSKEMIRRSEEMINKLVEGYPTQINKRNVENLQLSLHNLTEGFPKDEKFDVVFLSLIISYIPKDKRNDFFRDINNILKEDGRVVIFQLINQSKFDRIFSDWLLYVVPNYHGFPFKDEYLKMLSDNFKNIKCYMNSNIIVARKKQ